MVTAQSPARMSAYLVTREGQELGTFKTSKIEKGLKTGFFRVTDLGWRDASGWQGLAEIVGSVKASAAPSDAALMKSPGLNLDDFNRSAAPMTTAHADAIGRVPPTLIAVLTHTRSWVRFISVVMGIGCAFMIPVSLLLAVDGVRTLTDISGHHFTGGTQNLIPTIICLLTTLLILYPAVKLSNHAANIALLAKSQSLADLAAALMEQHRFWRFCGIVLLLHVCLALLLFVGSFFVTRVH